MPAHRHALVIGKFYPPHRGHHWLIRQTIDVAERTTVVVMSSVHESIPVGDRLEWLRQEHAADSTISFVGVRCDAPVDIDDPHVWATQVAIMRAGARSVTDVPIDVVVTSEAYGPELAERFGADHVVMPRTSDGLSASLVRHGLADRWDDLAPATRAGLALRVVVLGAESTGTTTICERIAERYRQRGDAWNRTGVVAEYGRDYTRRLMAQQGVSDVNDLAWERADFDVIGTEQTRAEDAAAAAGSPLLVCDTDALATGVWERRYLGTGSRAEPSYAASDALPRHDLYLLTDDVGVPWQGDCLRERDLEMRAAMTTWFEDALIASGQSWVLLTGSLEDRVRLAIRSIEPLLERRLSFTAPKTGPGFEATIIG